MDSSARDEFANVTLCSRSLAIRSHNRRAQETETWLNAKILGVTRLRLQVADLTSGYGPYVSVDSIMLCTN
ncbi:hypothetical protein ACIBG5_17090 [Kribbella sp. NPDC050241]|uniref:hypothetical protein n=1 Tax=Kribbella sp. NPDC050241 TaxID=3364115 RepID=UPI0037952C45